MIGACVRVQVQGVFFRACTAEEAEKLGVVGWVRNAPSGSVAGEAQGPKSQLETFRVLFACLLDLLSLCACMHMQADMQLSSTAPARCVPACVLCMLEMIRLGLGQDWLEHKGSPASRIDRCVISDERHDIGEPAFSSFVVRR